MFKALKSVNFNGFGLRTSKPIKRNSHVGNRTGVAMPVEDSRLSGFFRLSVEERREIVRKLASLDDTQALAWASTGELSEDSADRMIENVIGTMSLPVGVATNFIVDGKGIHHSILHRRIFGSCCSIQYCQEMSVHRRIFL